MKKILTVLIFTIGRQLLVAQDAYLTKNFNGVLIKEVVSTTSGGNISITSVSSDLQRVEVFIWPSKVYKKALAKEEIQQRLDELYELKVEITGNLLTANAKPKQRNMNWKNSLSISFKIYVNKDVTTDLNTSGGNIGLQSISGIHRLRTSGGNLLIENVKGNIIGETSGGNMMVKDTDADVDLSTSGGNIDADNCTGKIRLSTSGGSIFLAHLQGEINATTSGGNIKAEEITGELDTHTSGGNVNLIGLAGNVTAGTTGGNINVTVKTPGKFIKLRNYGGDIKLQLPAGIGYDFDLSGDKITTEGLVNFNGNIEQKELKGSVNGGGTKVTANAGSSKITLVLK